MMIALTPTEARCLAVSVQRLAGQRPAATGEGVLAIFRALNCVQIDPIRAVERTQLLVLWSRLGPFDPALLDQIQSDRHIFEAWAHCASFVLSEDYPLHAHWMRKESNGGGKWGQRVRDWVAANDALRQHILARLATDGPLTSSQFEDMTELPWESSGWTNGTGVTRMLDFLNFRGQVMAVGRSGNNRIWHLTDAWLPEWVDHNPWTETEVVRAAIEASLKALGVATAKQIKNHFTRGRYPGLEARLAELEQAGIIHRAQVGDRDAPWPGDWFIHQANLPLLEAIQAGNWSPRTVFLSPFDNLICDRERTEQLFDFFYRIEIYVPKNKRQYGYYVLPILHGEHFIGRMDSKIDRKTGVYQIEAIYAEQAEAVTPETGAAIAASLQELMTFIGARSLALGETIPPGWRAALAGLV